MVLLRRHLWATSSPNVGTLRRQGISRHTPPLRRPFGPQNSADQPVIGRLSRGSCGKGSTCTAMALGGERPVGTTTSQGRGFMGITRVTGERPTGTASRQQSTLASYQTPHQIHPVHRECGSMTQWRPRGWSEYRVAGAHSRKTRVLRKMVQQQAKERDGMARTSNRETCPKRLIGALQCKDSKCTEPPSY